MLALYLLGLPVACGFALHVVITTESTFVDRCPGGVFLPFILMIGTWPLWASWLCFVMMVTAGVHLARLAEEHLYPQENSHD